jgi:DNA-binding transcriptional regulator YiaG
MRKYLHFAADNLYLSNGYEVLESADGEIANYIDEQGLEQCVRLIVAQRPKRLNGRELRFLRRGLGLTQDNFGYLIDRDAQTVARIEKSDQKVARYVDLTLRVEFFKRFRPSESVALISSLSDEKANFCQERIILSYSTEGWTYKFDVPKYYFHNIAAWQSESIHSLVDNRLLMNAQSPYCVVGEIISKLANDYTQNNTFARVTEEYFQPNIENFLVKKWKA